MKITIVIPAYKEEARIGRVISEFKKSKLPIIVVDDGSTDNTYIIAKKKGVVVMQHAVNLGKGAAMRTGAEAAFKMGADAIIFVDGDGQHVHEDLNKFIEILKTNKFDVLIGSRNFGLDVPLVRYLGNKIASVIINIFFGIYVSDLLCGYRALTKKAFKILNLESVGYGIETEMVAKIGINRLKHCEVPVATLYYDGFKGVTIIDASLIMIDVIRWKILK